MGIISGMEARSRLENPAVPISSANIVAALGLGESTPAGVNVTQQKALGITAFWAGVRAISQAKAMLPAGVFERLDQGRRPATDHPVHRLLHERPNPFMSPFTFQELTAAHILTYGNWYAEIELDNGNQPIGLWPLLPDRTDVEMRGGEKVYWTMVNGVKVWLAANRVLHVPGLGFDGLRGYNVVKLHRDSLGLSIAANEYGAQFFGNSGRPSGFLKHPGKPQPEERQQFREEWNQMHTGLTRAQRTAVLWGGMDWHALSVPPEEAQFLGTRAMQIEEVARILGINPILLQHFEKATTWGTGVAQFLVAFGKFTVIPWLKRDEDEMNWALFSEADRGRYYVKYNVGALLRGDPETQAKVLEIKRRNGIVNGDEWRELDEENPLPDGQGKTYFVPLNWVPLDQAGRQTADPPPGNDGGNDEGAAGRALKRAREQRSITARRRLRQAHLAAFTDGAARYVRRDVQGVQRAVKQAFESGDNPVIAFNRWIEEFYPGQQQYIARTMLPLVSALAAVVAAQAFEEVGAEPEEIDAFAAAYTDNLAAREAGSSRGQLLALIDKTPAADLQDALSTRAEEWGQTRPGKVAADEVVRVSSGAARHAYQAAGITYMVWRANDGACPLCQSMDGRRSPVRGAFLAQGETVNPGGGVASLTTEHNITGPPLHGGCSCEIVPE